MKVNVNFLYVINGYYIVMRNDKRIGTLKFLPNKGWTYVAEWNGKSFNDEMIRLMNVTADKKLKQIEDESK